MSSSIDDSFNQEQEPVRSLAIQKNLFGSQQENSHKSEQDQKINNEEQLMAQVKKILYQENVSDDELILQVLTFFEEHKKLIDSQVIRNTFALVMSLYGIENIKDLTQCMHSAYNEGPSHSLSMQIEKTKTEILQLFKNQKKIHSSAKEEAIKNLLNNLVNATIDVAPHLKDEEDLSLRYKIVTSFIGKILGHMGRFQIDMLLELIRWLFPELEKKTAQIFGSDIWFYANGTFKKKRF